MGWSYSSISNLQRLLIWILLPQRTTGIKDERAHSRYFYHTKSLWFSAMYYCPMWPVGISTVFQRPPIVHLHRPNGRYMTMSSNWNIFRVTGLLCGEFTGHRWIPITKASDAELYCFLWSAPWINGWVNKREAGDLIRHRARYDVIVM